MISFNEMGSEKFEIMISIQNGHISYLKRSQGEFKITPIIGLLPMVLLYYLWFYKNQLKGENRLFDDLI